MQLVIAEKPSVAQSIASVLGARTKHDGYQEGNGYVVSWCFGHLAGLANADVYDAKYAKWKTEDVLTNNWFKSFPYRDGRESSVRIIIVDMKEIK